MFTAVLSGVLVILLCWACASDCRSRKIPNNLILFGIFFSFLSNLVFASPSWPSLVGVSLGVVLGFMLYLPLYLLRIMGAGDVKLLAMVGAYVGTAVWQVALYSLIAGAVLAILYALFKGRARVLLGNLRELLFVNHAKLASKEKLDLTVDSSRSAGRLPYAISITAGVFLYYGLKFI